MTPAMLARRLAATSPSLTRSLTTTPIVLRAPSLADITHDNAPSFDARQNEFRESQKAAAKAKEQQDSQSVKGSAPSSASASSASASSSSSSPGGASGGTAGGSDTDAGGPPPGIVANIAAKLPLGSLSTAATTGQARERSSQSESTKRKGALANLIYGTKEGQQLDQEIERSFSQVLARGKYVHSIVFHDVKPGKVDEYVELVGGWYPKVASNSDNHVNLVGSWRTEVGDCDTFGRYLTLPPTMARWKAQR